MRSVLLDRTGQVFGRLTVTHRGPDYVSPKGKRHVQWWCSCSCGSSKPVLVTVNGLRGKTTASCGCLKRERNRERLQDLTGQRFSRWVVLAPSTRVPDSAGRYHTVCRVRCDCGTERTVRANNLVQEQVKSCGCLQPRHPDWRAGVVGYGAAHGRVVARFGPASDRQCVDCLSRRAKQWSYDHSDIRELWELKTLRNGAKVWLPYSLDVHRYEPRCSSCHSIFDKAYLDFGRSL